jgi:hypothetical protein
MAQEIHTETSLQRQNAENLKQIFPEKEFRGLSPKFCERIIYSHDGSVFFAQFPEKEYINGIAVAVLKSENFQDYAQKPQ